MELLAVAPLSCFYFAWEIKHWIRLWFTWRKFGTVLSKMILRLVGRNCEEWLVLLLFATKHCQTDFDFVPNEMYVLFSWRVGRSGESASRESKDLFLRPPSPPPPRRGAESQRFFGSQDHRPPGTYYLLYRYRSSEIPKKKDLGFHWVEKNWKRCKKG